MLLHGVLALLGYYRRLRRFHRVLYRCRDAAVATGCDSSAAVGAAPSGRFCMCYAVIAIAGDGRVVAACAVLWRPLRVFFCELQLATGAHVTAITRHIAAPPRYQRPALWQALRHAAALVYRRDGTAVTMTTSPRTAAAARSAESPCGWRIPANNDHALLLQFEQRVRSSSVPAV